MSKRRTYLHNAALLTGSGLVLRALGMGFRVVLAAYLGSEGMGLYQLILALYMVFVSFATAGVNVASARLAAQSLGRGSGMAETCAGCASRRWASARRPCWPKAYWPGRARGICCTTSGPRPRC